MIAGAQPQFFGILDIKLLGIGATSHFIMIVSVSNEDASQKFGTFTLVQNFKNHGLPILKYILIPH